MSHGFTSRFAADLENMIALKVSLGYSASTYLERAHKFDRYCLMEHPEAEELTKGMALHWLKPDSEETCGGDTWKGRLPQRVWRLFKISRENCLHPARQVHCRRDGLSPLSVWG